jgi:hypothetical protein
MAVSLTEVMHMGVSGMVRAMKWTSENASLTRQSKGTLEIRSISVHWNGQSFQRIQISAVVLLSPHYGFSGTLLFQPQTYFSLAKVGGLPHLKKKKNIIDT